MSAYDHVDPIIGRLKASPQLRALGRDQWREIEAVLFDALDGLAERILADNGFYDWHVGDDGDAQDHDDAPGVGPHG